MRIFDCTTFYDENFILDVRFNILDPFVDKFVICESAYSHSGKKKKFNFDISKFEKFKHKIIYLKMDHEPKNLIYKTSNNEHLQEDTRYIRTNAIKRIAYQRNFLQEGISDASNNDFIFYSDNDEIPNMENFTKYKETNDIVIFEQKLFYYKFNLLFDRIFWYGTKAVKKKKLINFEWLRQVKPKKYNFYRLDTFFKKDKYINLKIVKDGGWHFTRVISPEEIHQKELDAEHHDEYRASNKNPTRIKDLIERRVIDHDHLADSKKSKYGNEYKLKVISMDELPEYIKMNWKKYEQFLDLRT